MAGGATLIYLVNSTALNFVLAWLYLTTGNSFWMYVFNYSAGESYWLQFTGQTHVSTNFVSIPLPSVPQYQFTPQSKITNAIFINGQNVTINGNNGTYDGQPAYAIWNLLNITGAWNELWLLTGDYHYVILYTYPNGAVFSGSNLNLNNYQYTPWPDGYQVNLGSWQLYTPPNPVPEFPYNLLPLLSVLFAILILRKRRISLVKISEHRTSYRTSDN